MSQPFGISSSPPPTQTRSPLHGGNTDPNEVRRLLSQQSSSPSTDQTRPPLHGGNTDPNEVRRLLSQQSSTTRVLSQLDNADPSGQARSQNPAVQYPPSPSSTHGAHSDTGGSSSQAPHAHQAAHQPTQYGHYQSAQPQSNSPTQIQYSQTTRTGPQNPSSLGSQSFQQAQTQTPQGYPPRNPNQQSGSYGTQTPQGYPPQNLSNQQTGSYGTQPPQGYPPQNLSNQQIGSYGAQTPQAYRPQNPSNHQSGSNGTRPPQGFLPQAASSFGTQSPQGYIPQGAILNPTGNPHNPAGPLPNGPQPANLQGNPPTNLFTNVSNYQPALERGYGNLFSDRESRRVKWPNFYQLPGIRRPGNGKKPHRDPMGRRKDFELEDFYLSPFDCHLAKLVVQCSQDVYDAKSNSTWRRTFVRNMSPVILRVARWVLETVPKEDRPMTGEEIMTLGAKWLPACALLLLLMAYPTNIGGQIRNGGRYDAFPYKFWGYPYHGRNKIEERPLDEDHFNPYHSEQSVALAKINPISKRPLEPNYLCFLKDGEGAAPGDVKEWKRKHGRAADYVLVSYTSEQFHGDEEELFLHDVGEYAARKAGVAAYWVGCACLGTRDELSENVWRISDIIRGAHSMVIVVSNTANSGSESLLKQWGSRVWTLPEILLSPGNEAITVYERGESLRNSLNTPKSIKKRNMASELEDGELSRQLIDHYEGSLVLGPLELITVGLRCLHGREKGKYLEGDMSYALMGLLRQRPTVVRKDSAFQAFARLSLANDSNLLLERLICVLPKTPSQPWHDMDDQWNVALWDIYPSTQICGIGEDDTIILDNAHAANIRWKSFVQVLTLQAASWKRLLSGFIFRSMSYIFFLGIGLVSLGASTQNGLFVGLGALFLVIGSILTLLSPYLMNILFAGKIWGAQPWFFGFEGYMDLHTIEKQIFGANMNHLSWSTAGSPLSRHSSNEYGECEGRDPTTDPDTAARVRNAVHSRMGEEKIFTLVDTSTMTVTMFAAVRPPVAVVVCGQEGGMQRALLCSYDSTTQTLYRETVLRMETPVLDVMSRLGRFRFGFQSPPETYS